jgi:hypothetical protein
VVCAGPDTTPRCGVPCRRRRCRTVPWSSPRNVTLQMSRVAELGPLCRQHEVARYQSPENTGSHVTGHQGARQKRSHLEQVRDAFSSCESRNFPLLGASWLAASTRAGLGWGATQGIGCSVLTWTVLRRRAGREKQSRRHASVGRRRGVCDRHASMGVPNVALP